MKHATVIDAMGSMWVEMACTLARYGIDVNYYSAWEKSSVSIRDVAPGSGLEDEGVTRVDSPFDLEAHDDTIWVFPWLHQEGLASGTQQFGATSIEFTYLERDRSVLHELLKKAGAPTIDTDVLVGVSALAQYLKAHDDRWIKVSNWRGDIDTWHHDDLTNSLIELAAWTTRLGPFAESVAFRAQPPIESEVELSVNTFFCGGQFLAPAAVGYEIKDKLEVDRITADLPTMVYDATEALAPYLKKVGYNNFFTNEMRITKDGTAYVTDVTTRCPIPPGAAMLEALDNFPEVIENGSQNKPTVLKWAAKYLCEVVITSDEVRHDWLEVRFPPELRHFVKMRNFCKVDGHYWIPPIVPHEMTPDVISVVGYGSTLNEAKNMARENAEAVCKKTFHATFDVGAFDEVDDTIEKGVKLGIEF